MDAMMRQRMAVVAAVAAGVVMTQGARAAVRTWSATADSNFNTDANWSPSGVIAGNDARFVGAPSQYFIDTPPSLTADVSILSLAFDTGGWSLNGANTLTLTAPASTVTFNPASTGGQLTINAPLRLGNSNTYNFNVSSGNTLTVANAISATAAMTDKVQVSGGGILVLQGSADPLSPNIRFGDLLVNAGTVKLDMNGVVAMGGKLIMSGTGSAVYLRSNQILSAQLYRLDDTSSIDLNGNAQTIQSVTFNNTVKAAGAGTVDLRGGKLTLTSGTPITTNASADTARINGNDNANSELAFTTAATLTVADGLAPIDLDISAKMTGGNVIKAGAGVARLSGNNTYTGTTAVNAGTLLVDGVTSGQNNYAVKSGATLGGVGAIGLASARKLTVEAGGHLSPGASAGVLSISGSQTGSPTAGAATVNFQAASSFNVDITGVSPGALGYDQLSVTGNVDLGGAMLSVNLGSFTLDDNQTFTIISNDGTSDLALNTFAGLAQGDTVVIQSGYALKVSYSGEAGAVTGGNDVVLYTQAIPEPAMMSLTAASGMLLLPRRRKVS